VADPTKPDRGIAPLVSYAVSEFETINPGTGNLIYQFSIAKLPPGRGGLTVGLSLNYNSTIYDASLDLEAWGNNPSVLTGRLGPSNTGGGWQYSYQYGLLEESIPLKDCSVSLYVTRFSVVFPDGGRHILQLYDQGFPNDGDGGGRYLPNGQPSCPGTPAITSGSLTYFTTDGTFIRVVLAANSFPWTTNLWTMYMPDGSRVDGFGSQASHIWDRNANCVWFNNFDPDSNQGAVQTLIGDSFGRVINLQRFGSFVDYISQTGFFETTSRLTTVAWGTTSVSRSNLYVCTVNEDECSAYGLNTNVVESICATSVGTDAVTYSFAYDDQSAPGSGRGWGELRQVALPSAGGETPATVNYTYLLAGGLRAYDALYNPVVRKEVDWQETYDGLSVAGPPDVWTYSGAGGGGQTVIVTAPDGGQT
jgi:hypothetical protein